MKKWLSILLTLVLILSVTACGKTEEPAASMDLTDGEDTPAVEEPADSEPASDLDALAVAYFDNMPDHKYMISQKDFVELVKSDEEITVIDIRSAEDYGKGHIEGAVNMPWGPAIAEGLTKVPTDKPVFIYCYTGQTAGQAVMTYNLAGFDARTVSFGWNLGISKVDGVDAVTTTDATTFDADVTEIDATIQEAITAYYEGLAEVSDSKYKNYKVSEDDLKAMVDLKDDSIVILSVRGAKDYAVGHIEDAINIPFAKGMANSFGSLPKDKTIVVYCYTGQTAGQVTADLRLMGYDAVSLNGGMGKEANAPMGWTNKGYPVVSEASAKVEALYNNMPAHIYKVAQADFVEKVVAGEEMTILDIRGAADYEKGHIKGAVNVPWGMAIAETLVNIPNDKPVYIYCYTGQTAGQAVTTYNVAGFEAYSVNLGWNLGISKVEGVDAVTTTDVATLDTAVTEIPEAIQHSITAYYEGMVALSDSVYKNYKISEADLNAMMEAKDESIYILSIRKAEDFAAGHIENASNTPFGTSMISEFKNLPKDKVIVVYCYTGQTAGQATAALRLMGYKAVSLNGGMGNAANAPMGWANQGLLVVQ